MSKKRKKAHPVQAVKPKSDVVWRQSAEEATLASKPRYNGFACGHGALDSVHRAFHLCAPFRLRRRSRPFSVASPFSS